MPTTDICFPISNPACHIATGTYPLVATFFATTAHRNWWAGPRHSDFPAQRPFQDNLLGQSFHSKISTATSLQRFPRGNLSTGTCRERPSPTTSPPTSLSTSLPRFSHSSLAQLRRRSHHNVAISQSLNLSAIIWNSHNTLYPDYQPDEAW